MGEWLYLGRRLCINVKFWPKVVDRQILFRMGSKRLELIKEIVDDYRIDGVVELTWHGCHTYNVESFLIKNFVNEQCQRPYLHIETDYAESDLEQIRVRIEAFLEMIS